MGVIFVILSSLLLLLLALYVLTTWKYDYWKKRKVLHLKPLPFFGNYFQSMSLHKNFADVSQQICKQFPNAPYIGTFYGTEPALLIQDPELIGLIIAKDFAYFSGRECSDYSERETVMKTMFFTYGDKWKVIRQNSTPLFTSSKAKNMFHLIQDCTRKLEDLLEYETGISPVMDMKTLTARYTIDCICNCAFGVNPNAMDKDGGDHPLKKIGDLIFEVSKLRAVAVYSRQIWPRIFYALGFSVFPKEITDFFNGLLLKVFEQRKQTKSTRNDFVDLILSLKEREYITSKSIMASSKGEDVMIKVDDDFLIAQCILFFAAGFETTASTTCLTLYELAQNQEVQNRVLKEIEEYLQKREGKVEYDCVTELPYLDACVHEAMRLHPALATLTREVTDDYTLPDGLQLEKGLRIILPVYHLHHHAKYFPEPEKFKPERFLPENKSNINQYAYLAFGEGQRLCAGMRVGMMQLMAGLVTILRKYRVEPTTGTPKTVSLHPCAVITQHKENILVKLVPRN